MSWQHSLQNPCEHHLVDQGCILDAVGIAAVGTKILHDLTILQYYNSQGIRHLGSCRIFSIHRVLPWVAG